MHVNLIKKKKPFDWLLLIIYFGVFIADLNYSALSSFYPVEANKQVQLSETIIGFVFASYSIGMFVATFVVAKLMSKRGRKKMFVILGLLF
jgi:MFS family permease